MKCEMPLIALVSKRPPIPAQMPSDTLRMWGISKVASRVPLLSLDNWYCINDPPGSQHELGQLQVAGNGYLKVPFVIAQ